MKGLISYYSRTGNTKKVAEKISERLNIDLERIVDKKNRSGIIGWIKAGYDAKKGNLTEIENLKKKPSNYDFIILGSPIWGGNVTPAIKTYLKNNKDHFKEIIVYFTSKGGEFKKATRGVINASGREPLVVYGFVEQEIKENKIDQQLENFTNEIKEKVESKT